MKYTYERVIVSTEEFMGVLNHYGENSFKAIKISDSHWKEPAGPFVREIIFELEEDELE